MDRKAIPSFLLMVLCCLITCSGLAMNDRSMSTGSSRRLPGDEGSMRAFMDRTLAYGRNPTTLEAGDNLVQEGAHPDYIKIAQLKLCLKEYDPALARLDVVPKQAEFISFLKSQKNRPELAEYYCRKYMPNVEVCWLPVGELLFCAIRDTLGDITE